MARTNLGIKLRKHRRSLDFTQKEMSAVIGVTNSTLSLYESGGITASREMESKILAVTEKDRPLDNQVTTRWQP